jgi:hypothetical protein
LELIHAYSLERIAQMSEAKVAPASRVIKGTALRCDALTLLALSCDAGGMHCSANANTVYVDFSNAVDASRVDPYWITVGWLIVPDTVASGTWTSGIFGMGSVGVVAPSSVFPVTNGQQAYLEFALNPITGVLKVYVNGTVIFTTTYNTAERLVRIMYGPGFGYLYTIKDIYVARFENTEEPRLRRWKSVTLPAVTNNIGSNAALQTVDGTQVSIGASEVQATFTIPPKTLGICAQSSMLAPDNASDLVTTLTDGTINKSLRTSDMNNQLVVDLPRKGHSVHAGNIIPAANATTLTLGVKAVTRS